MKEVTQEVKRSELYNEIYAIVKQIPRANVDSDCMDASSASVAIEELIASRESSQLSAVPSEEEIDIAEDAWYLLTCAKDNLLPGQYEQYEKKIQLILKRGDLR